MTSSRTIRSAFAVTAGAAVLATTLVACAPTGDAASRPQPDGFGHIHAFGIDASSGTAYVATHAGVWKLPPLDSEPVAQADLDGPIGGTAMDAMTFTMDGTAMYLSGHPDPAEYPDLDPANLGLLVSNDRGLAWKSLSLWGDTDFHDLAVFREGGGGVRVYGYVSETGTIRSSLDSGASWTDGQTGDFRDIAADPTIAGTVYATSADGLMGSADDGTTFTRIPDAPTLLLVDTARMDQTTLIAGVDVKGNVWVKAAGADWRSTGSLQAIPTAFALSDGAEPVLLAADERGVVVSSDFGANWRVLIQGAGATG